MERTERTMSNDIKPSNEVAPKNAVAIDEVPIVVANRFTPDAQDRVARLRAWAADFPDEKDSRPLTRNEILVARITSPAALEKAALFAEAAPELSTGIADVVDFREAIAFELAYGGVRDEAQAVARRIDRAILRRKLKASLTARGLYRMAKGYVTMDAGDAVRPHLAEMKRALVRPPRRKRNAEAPPEDTAKAAQK
jgi:hypothetical protein